MYHYHLPMHARIRELIDYLDEQRVVLRDAFDAVPAGLRETPLAPDCWSAANTIEHLAIVEQRIAVLLTKKIEAARAEGAAPDPATGPILPSLGLPRILDRSRRVDAPAAVVPTGLSADAAWEALERSGAAVRDVLRGSGDVDLGALAHPHPLFGPLSLYEWAAFVGGHEARHAEQIRESILRQR
jgi:DinB superfamily